MEKPLYESTKIQLDTYFNSKKFGPGEIEIESRINRYDEEYGIGYKAFVNISTFFEKNLKEKINSIDYLSFPKEISVNVVYNISLRKEVYDNYEVYTKKYTPNIFRKDLRFVKYTLSYEEKKEKPEESYQFVRIKNRNRYVVNFKNVDFIIDLTHVKDDRGIIYELEVVAQKLEDLKTTAYQYFIEHVLKVMYNTENFYNVKDYFEIIEVFNSRLKSKEKKKFDFNVLYQPRNLKIDDLKYGGLIGYQIPSDNDEPKKEVYTVSFKADGIRKLLITYNRNLWLVYPPNEANLVIKNIPSDFDNYILDGELIPQESRIPNFDESKLGVKNPIFNYPYWYLSFDCLYDPKDEYKVENYDQLIRLLRSGIVSKLKSTVIKVDTKNKLGEFKELTDVEKFYDVMNEMEQLKTLINYKTDGYIFTPINMTINDFKSKLNLKERELSKHRDICKWKPPEQISIDFKYKNGKLWSSSGQNQEVIFTGNAMYPYTGNFETILLSGLVQKGKEDEKQIEIKNDEIVEFVFINDKFIPIRIRYDKISPNRIEFALDNWNLIHRPISLNTLLGKSIELMTRYHNTVKATLFADTNRKPFIEGQVKTLLDIGSGRGGDLAKWHNFKKIIAVEPNKDYIEELKSRATNLLNQLVINVIDVDDFKDDTYRRKCYEANLKKDRIIVINCGGEEYEKIQKVQECFTGGQCDITSLMLSLSFFWKEKEMLNKLIKTINNCTKDDGRVIFMTINGNCLEQAFKDVEYINMLNNVGIKLEQKEDKSVLIDIPNSIVENQTEYFVKITDLIKGLKFELKEHTIANGQQFLNKYELILTSLYSFGYFEA